MKVYSKKHHRNVERQIHFGVGRSVKTACGLVLFSRHIMVSVFSSNDGAIITDNFSRVTCKRCLATKDMRLRKLIMIEATVPGIFDHETICGEQWILTHALNISQKAIDAQTLHIKNEKRNIILSNKTKSKDRKYILRNLSSIKK